MKLDARNGPLRQPPLKTKQQGATPAKKPRKKRHIPQAPKRKITKEWLANKLRTWTMLGTLFFPRAASGVMGGILAGRNRSEGSALGAITSTIGAVTDAQTVDTINYDQAHDRLMNQKPVNVKYLDVSGDRAAPALAKCVGPFVRLADEGATSKEVVDNILEAADGRPIKQLDLWAHGSPGAHYLSTEAHLKLTAFEVATHADEWRRLGEHLAPDAVIDLYGCSVGHGDDGARLLMTLSSYTGATVRAGEPLQIPDPGWLDGIVRVAQDGDLYRVRSANSLGNWILQCATPRAKGQIRVLTCADDDIGLALKDRFGVDAKDLAKSAEWTEFLQDVSQGKSTALNFAYELATAIYGQSSANQQDDELALALDVVDAMPTQNVTDWYYQTTLQDFEGQIDDRGYPFSDVSASAKEDLQQLMLTKLESTFWFSPPSVGSSR